MMTDRIKSNEIEIVEGHDCSSYFWIHPCNVNMEPKYDYWEMVEEDEEEISIEEDIVWEFLAYFFLKHFDENLDVNKIRGERLTDMTLVNKIEGFEWYLEHNFYTYEGMNAVLADIENLCNLILEGKEDEIRIQYPERKFGGYHEINLFDYIYNNMFYTKEAVPAFYRKFVHYIREMIRKHPECKYFSVMGP